MFNTKYPYFQQAADDLSGASNADPAPEGGDPAPADPAPAEPTEGYWKDDWRQKYAGEDSSKLNALSRYASPEAAFDALMSAQEKIRSGQVRPDFPAEGTDEEKSAWRQANGVPETATQYDLNFESGLVIGEEDKEFVDQYLEQAHAMNQTPEQVKGALEWYYENREQQMQARHELDKQAAEETNQKLREEWGQEYDAHKNQIMNFLNVLPQESREGLMGARKPDGTPVMSDPEILRTLLGWANEINPVTTIVPAGPGQASQINDEIYELEKQMGDRDSDYWKDDRKQERYRQLISARDKLQQG